MNIRRLQVQDIAAYWRLRLQALKQFPQSFGASYEDAKDTPIVNIREKFSAADDNFIVGAFTESGELIGMVGFRQETPRKMRHKGMVWGMYVEESCQGQGVGKRLLMELLQSAHRVPGLERIHLYVVDTNLPAKRLYQSLGFRTYGLEIHAMKLDANTYVNEELMVYELERAGSARINDKEREDDDGISNLR
ncbi:GNAT family N-acetyltransferase [Paenibacillus sacheonensis]|uniref:GNAT family N-acetyltransferase n=1 Tax=Paenibacillus sacheonensis TaxID=742054 RepID=A0A7X4YVW3_9BACL|nr:GNAT family N-acetyltransferase [Paenibacillus sacheonensis]MBM7568829.1 RimJ/RimL family protein N-acetyltransferase [Paenibacillus sacheonensis]NBC72534.1 GNAT family N-acetyltransferase [Paenibacillus sacheonensis]